MSKKFDFEYIVLGSGTAGCITALRLAEGGKKVALVTGPEFGGSELSFASLGLSANSDFATAFHEIKAASAIKTDYLGLNFGELALRTRHKVEKEQVAWRERLEMAGVKIFPGSATLLDRHWVLVQDSLDSPSGHGNTPPSHPSDTSSGYPDATQPGHPGTSSEPTNIPSQLSAENIILATGTRPKVAEIEGLDQVNFLTPSDALRLEVQPKFVLIVGGGETGTELASYFAKLGIRVLVMEKLERILPHEDKEVSEAVTTSLKEELDVMVVPNAKVTRLEQDAFSKRVIFSSGGGEKVVRVDCIVLATGSEPILDYGLEQAKVPYRRSGITVGPHFETSAKNIYALGDAVDSPLRSTPLRSALEAEILTTNLLKKRSQPAHSLRGRGGRFVPKYVGLPRRIRVSPEVATVGMNERDLLTRDLDFRQVMLPHDDFRENDAYYPGKSGFVKLLLGQHNELYGASAVGARADAVISELALALSEGVPLEAFIPTKALAKK